MKLKEPYQILGPVDIRALQERVQAMAPDDWVHTRFRAKDIAGPEHRATRSLIFRMEWAPGNHRVVTTNLVDVVAWHAKKFDIDPKPLLPLMREDCGDVQIYTMRQWAEWQDVLLPVLNQAIAPLNTPHGVLVRVALVCLPAGEKVAWHIDGQNYAARTHRIHVPVTGWEGVDYTVGLSTFKMAAGYAYDFNNCEWHGIVNRGTEDRVNLFVEYMPQPPSRWPSPLVISL